MKSAIQFFVLIHQGHDVTSWGLHASIVRNVDNVDVSDCDASKEGIFQPKISNRVSTKNEWRCLKSFTNVNDGDTSGSRWRKRGNEWWQKGRKEGRGERIEGEEREVRSLEEGRERGERERQVMILLLSSIVLGTNIAIASI